MYLLGQRGKEGLKFPSTDVFKMNLDTTSRRNTYLEIFMI